MAIEYCLDIFYSTNDWLKFPMSIAYKFPFFQLGMNPKSFHQKG